MQPTQSPKVQSPAALAGLTLATLGFYTYYWYYRVNREMRDLGRAYDVRDLAESRPARSVWALIAGAVLIVPALVSYARTARRVDACERLAGRPQGGVAAVTALITVSYVLGFSASSLSGTAVVASVVVACLACWLWAITAIQRRLNAVWRQDLVPAAVTVDEAVAAA
jgi:hypothetical protein